MPPKRHLDEGPDERNEESPREERQRLENGSHESTRQKYQYPAREPPESYPCVCDGCALVGIPCRWGLRQQRHENAVPTRCWGCIVRKRKCCVGNLEILALEPWTDGKTRPRWPPKARELATRCSNRDRLRRIGNHNAGVLRLGWKGLLAADELALFELRADGTYKNYPRLKTSWKGRLRSARDACKRHSQRQATITSDGVVAPSASLNGLLASASARRSRRLARTADGEGMFKAASGALPSQAVKLSLGGQNTQMTCERHNAQLNIPVDEPEAAQPQSSARSARRTCGCNARPDKIPSPVAQAQSNRATGRRMQVFVDIPIRARATPKSLHDIMRHAPPPDRLAQSIEDVQWVAMAATRLDSLVTDLGALFDHVRQVRPVALEQSRTF